MQNFSSLAEIRRRQHTGTPGKPHLVSGLNVALPGEQREDVSSARDSFKYTWIEPMCCVSTVQASDALQQDYRRSCVLGVLCAMSGHHSDASCIGPDEKQNGGKTNHFSHIVSNPCLDKLTFPTVRTTVHSRKSETPLD